MANKDQLTDAILEALEPAGEKLEDLEGNLDDMTNEQLSKLLIRLRAKAGPAEKPRVKKGAPFDAVAPGVSITSKAGLLKPGEAITADILGGGAKALDALKKSGKVVREEG